MKTYVLTVSQKFAARHPRAGELTNFPSAILEGRKIHTIRANFDLWQKRIDEVSKGAACLSIRVWTGKPYNSPQQEIASLTAADGVGIERVNLYGLQPIVNGKLIDPLVITKNDGLAFEDFEQWFKDYDLIEPMAIIHFTPFRYNEI